MPKKQETITPQTEILPFKLTKGELSNDLLYVYKNNTLEAVVSIHGSIEDFTSKYYDYLYYRKDELTDGEKERYSTEFTTLEEVNSIEKKETNYVYDGEKTKIDVTADTLLIPCTRVPKLSYSVFSIDNGQLEEIISYSGNRGELVRGTSLEYGFNVFYLEHDLTAEEKESYKEAVITFKEAKKILNQDVPKL